MEETKLSRKVQEDEEYTQQIWEEITGIQYLLSEDCDWLDEKQKDQIRRMSGYQGVDYEKVLSVGRKLLRNQVVEWAEEVAGEYWATKSRTIGINMGYLGVRLRWGKWVYAINWFRSRKHGGNNFSETITIPSNAKQLHPKRVEKFAKPQEIEAMVTAEESFEKIRDVNEKIKQIGNILHGVTLTLRHQRNSQQLGQPEE